MTCIDTVTYHRCFEIHIKYNQRAQYIYNYWNIKTILRFKQLNFPYQHTYIEMGGAPFKSYYRHCSQHLVPIPIADQWINSSVTATQMIGNHDIWFNDLSVRGGTTTPDYIKACKPYSSCYYEYYEYNGIIPPPLAYIPCNN